MEVNDQREKDVNDMYEKEGMEGTGTHSFEKRSMHRRILKSY